jgi:glycosyltransferase involved in cell wall biosynthesis
LVAICIATYRRPEGLDRLLRALAEQRFPVAAPRIKVIVIDNDAAGESTGSVQAAIERWRSRFDELVFEREPEVGISFARNRALDLAGDVDFVAFIDDDEEPAPDWLRELLAVQAEYDADVVRGPVVPWLGAEPAAWLSGGGLFDRPRHATGTQLEVAYTHNALLRWPPYCDLRFSPRYARSGGEDAHFFGRIYQRGARIIWAANAVVREWQPPSRQNVRWLVRRQYRIGMMRAIIDAELRLSPRPRLTSATQAWTRIAGGLGGLVTSIPGPKERRVRALGRLAAGVGRLAGLVGLWFEEYRD